MISVCAVVNKICLLSIYLSIYLSRPIYLSIYGSTVLLLDLGRFFSFLIIFTVGTTPWTGDQSLVRPLPYTEQYKHRINAHRHLCLKWDSNPRSQYLSERRQVTFRKTELSTINTKPICTLHRISYIWRP
jgi:hypothetical protein